MEQVIGKKHLVGTCLEMCPRKEAKEHEKYEISEFEVDPKTNKFREDLAITSYHRSFANRKFVPDQIRPLPVLQKTMKHILNYIIGQRLNTSEKTKEIDLLLYLRGRFRSMCSDIASQHLEGEEVIELYQTMVLFFIWAGARFPNNYDSDTFDVVMNLQFLTDLFDQLDVQYNKYLIKTKMHHPYEADFRSFALLLYISNDAHQFMAQAYSLIPHDLMETEPIKNVFKLRQAVISQNFAEFIKVINLTPIQFSVMALQNIPDFYYNTFLSARKAFRNFKFDKDIFTTYLDLPNNYFNVFTKCFSIIPDTNDPKCDLYSFELNAHPDPSNSPKLPLPLDIQQRFDKSPLLDFLKLKPSAPNIASHVEIPIPIPPSDFQIQTEIENKAQDIVENEAPLESNQLNPVETEHISPQPSIIEEPNISPKISDFEKVENPFENKENVEENESVQPIEDEIEQPSSRLSQFESQQFQTSKESDEDEKIPIPFLLTMKMVKRVGKQKLFDFVSMIPPNLPPFCFISVLVNDSDDSPSAKFAYDCFNRLKTSNNLSGNKKYIIYLGDSVVSSVSCPKSHVYISIVRKQLQQFMNSVGSILNCEDTTIYEGEEDDIPILTFSLDDSKSSPEIRLNSLMRKCIEKAVVEFQPLNLTDIVKNALELSMKIVLSPKWQRSSCNSILNLINKVNDSVADLFESESFMRFLLPFIHGEFGPNKMSEFASSIRKMKISLIEKEESVKPRLDSNWPLFIRDNMKIKSMTPFIAPVSVKFDPQEFLDQVISPFENTYPTEYVLQQEDEETSFTDILHAFDCDLYE